MAIISSHKIFVPTVAERRVLKESREDYKKGRYLTINEAKLQLGSKNKR